LSYEIGFYEKNRYFKHPETEIFIEFPSGPLAIGNELVTDIIKIETDTGILNILSPTECFKDRLAAYYFWNDRQSLDQAILVSTKNDVDMNEIRRWSIKEDEVIKFNIFRKRLKLIINAV